MYIIFCLTFFGAIPFLWRTIISNCPISNVTVITRISSALNREAENLFSDSDIHISLTDTFHDPLAGNAKAKMGIVIDGITCLDIDTVRVFFRQVVHRETAIPNGIGLGTAPCARVQMKCPVEPGNFAFGG